MNRNKKIERVGQSFMRHIDIIFNAIEKEGIKNAKLYTREYCEGGGIIWIDKKNAKRADKVLVRIGAIGFAGDDDINFSGSRCPIGENE